jgi:hypothetical protein
MVQYSKKWIVKYLKEKNWVRVNPKGHSTANVDSGGMGNHQGQYLLTSGLEDDCQ